MIGVLTPKKKPPRSAGKDGKQDFRRWVIIILRNNGANEAQFPLPVTVNSERIAFGRDEPVIAPAYFLDTIDNCVLPKYEKTESTDTAAEGQVRNEDDATMLELKYTIEVVEIEKEFQTTDGIQKFLEILHAPECPEEYEHIAKARFGQTSFNQHNYAWSVLNEKKPKKETKSANPDKE